MNYWNKTNLTKACSHIYDRRFTDPNIVVTPRTGTREFLQDAMANIPTSTVRSPSCCQNMHCIGELLPLFLHASNSARMASFHPHWEPGGASSCLDKGNSFTFYCMSNNSLRHITRRVPNLLSLDLSSFVE